MKDLNLRILRDLAKKTITSEQNKTNKTQRWHFPGFLKTGPKVCTSLGLTEELADQAFPLTDSEDQTLSKIDRLPTIVPLAVGDTSFLISSPTNQTQAPTPTPPLSNDSPHLAQVTKHTQVFQESPPDFSERQSLKQDGVQTPHFP